MSKLYLSQEVRWFSPSTRSITAPHQAYKRAAIILCATNAIVMPELGAGSVAADRGHDPGLVVAAALARNSRALGGTHQ
jgi:hypothetical protein